MRDFDQPDYNISVGHKERPGSSPGAGRSGDLLPEASMAQQWQEASWKEASVGRALSSRALPPSQCSVFSPVLEELKERAASPGGKARKTPALSGSEVWVDS